MSGRPIEQSADRIRRYRYVELELFSLTGGRSVEVSSPEIAVYLSAASAAHGYRAALFEPMSLVSVGIADRPPESPQYLIAVAAVMDRLRTLNEVELVHALVHLVYRQSIDVFSADLSALSSASDGPIRRALRRAICDIELVIEEAMSLSMLRPPFEPSDEVAAALSAAGGLYGSD